MTDHFEQSLPLLPLRGMALFPGTLREVVLGRRRSRALASAIQPGDHLVAAVQRDPSVSDPSQQDLLNIATLARVESKRPHPRGGVILLLEGVQRVEVERLTAYDPYWRAQVAPLDKEVPLDAEAALLSESLLSELRRKLGDEAVDTALVRVPSLSPDSVADALAGVIPLSGEEAAGLLITLEPGKRLRDVARLAGERLHGADLQEKIAAEVRDALGQKQREAILRQQLVAIRKELGETKDDDDEDEIEQLSLKLSELQLDDSSRKRVEREMKRLRSLPANQMEYNVAKTWLEWIASLPWGKSVEVNDDLNAVEEQLNQDHYGLQDVKKRILEHMAVLQLTGKHAGSLLCLAGPPGVGKTSLAKSIADATGRPFVRVSLGGVRDEAEIRGHRRTYVGALPGRIIEALRKAEADNPVFLLDEIDKLSHGGWSGSPESALLEVLDPEQNGTFTDHYMELPFDLSKVLFICTANDLSQLSPPLRDRLEIVTLDGYTPDEKVRIGWDHLLPQVLDAHGVVTDAVDVADDVMDTIVMDYTREAGVRQLKRELARLCRSVALTIAKGETEKVAVDIAAVRTILGKRKFFSDAAERLTQPGLATGLAWTAAGGDILFIETSQMPGQGAVKVTGQLGDVMKESAEAAFKYVRSNAGALGVDPAAMETRDVHIHVPAGGVPKDGPSAGVTIFTALTSLLTGRLVRSDTAMTGECTLRGRVLPVGGVKSKVLAAHRAGMKRVILPSRCERDLDEVPQEILDELEIIFVDDMTEVLTAALVA